MLVVTREYVWINPNLNEIKNIIKNTHLEYEQKYGYHYNRDVIVKCSVEFFDKKNETIIILIECYNVFGKIQKVMQSSHIFMKFIRAFELILRIQGRIYENVEIVSLEGDNVRILWKKCFMKIANIRERVAHRFNQYCREKHFIRFYWRR